MKITWSPLSGDLSFAPIVLGDDALNKGTGMKLILNWLPDFQQQTQATAFVRAPKSRTFGRLNLATTVRFDVAYQFSTADECRWWITTLGMLMGSQGNLDADFPSGRALRMLSVWSPISAQRQIGVSAQISYTFTGGGFAANT